MKRHWVLVALAGAGALSLLPGFLTLAPNRLAPGHAVNLFACAPGWGVAILLALAAIGRAGWMGRPAWALAASMLLVLLTPLAAGAGAGGLLRHAGAASRAQLGAGAWLLLSTAALACMDAVTTLRLFPAHRILVTACLCLGLVAIGLTGWLAPLSLASEYASHRDAFATATGRHVLLVSLTLAGVALAGLPLGLAAWQRPALRGPVFGILNVVQTLPSIALFGLLLTPLSRIGLSDIGIVPAVIALVLYALLPTVRAVVTGLQDVPEAPLEAASGLGFTRSQLFMRVRLPLAAPSLLAGLRVVVVQTVGLAVVAALIGAGGFGDFVFQGLGQYALDLVLLGALPATFLALLADALLSLAADVAARRTA